jgi:hypothetical protein
MKDIQTINALTVTPNQPIIENVCQVLQAYDTHLWEQVQSERT